MKNTRLEIKYNEAIALRTWKMVLWGDCFSSCRPGQFIDIALEGKFLRRPISISNATADELTIIYKVVGEGTEMMSRMKAGQTLEVLLPLGNGFDTEACLCVASSAGGAGALLVGGGLGVAPLYLLARTLVEKGVRPTVVLGFNTASEVYLDKEFEALGVPCTIATMDGSRGVKGLVTDAIRTLDPKSYGYFYTCGPKVMMKAVCELLPDCPGELSMEERMGCGCGICYGCTCHTAKGAKRVCADGPIFKKEDIVW